MKRRVKDHDLRDAGSKELACCLDSLQISRVVKRREVDAVFYSFDDFVVDDDRPREFLAAMHHPMTDGMNISQRTDTRNVPFGGDNPAKQVVKRSAVITQGSRLFYLGSPVCLHGDQRLPSDSLNNAFCKLFVFFFFDKVKIGFDDLELKGRRAAIEYEDVHWMMVTCKV